MNRARSNGHTILYPKGTASYTETVLFVHKSVYIILNIIWKLHFVQNVTTKALSAKANIYIEYLCKTVLAFSVIKLQYIISILAFSLSTTTTKKHLVNFA